MKLIKSFTYAINGLLIAIREQRNMKIHLLAVVIIIGLGFYFNFTYVDWALISLTIGLVIGFEVFNTAIEELVNFVSPEKRNEAKRVKDFAAGAVLIVSLGALAVGLIILQSKIF